MNPLESNLLDPSFGGPPYPNQAMELLSPTPTSPQPGVSAPWPAINIPDTPLVSEETCPFEPSFSTVEGVVYVSIKPSGYLVNRGELGHHEGRLGLFGGEPINNPDPDDNDWEPPKKQLTNGNWVLWLVDDGNKNGNVVLSVELDTADDPEGGEFVDIWKLATFTVALSEVTTPVFYACNGLEHSRSDPADFYPHLWYNAEEELWKVSFTQGYVHSVNDGFVEPFTILGSDFEAAGEQLVEDGDEWFAHVSTDSNGLVGIGGANFEKFLAADDDPETIEFIEESFDDSPFRDGEYYYKVVSFELVGDVMTPTVHRSGSIDWHIRAFNNVGEETTIIKSYNSGIYAARSLVGDDLTNKEDPETGDTRNDLLMTVELKQVDDGNGGLEDDPDVIHVKGTCDTRTAATLENAGGDAAIVKAATDEWMYELRGISGTADPEPPESSGKLNYPLWIEAKVDGVDPNDDSILLSGSVSLDLSGGIGGNTSVMTDENVTNSIKIATHDDGTGLEVEINETITELEDTSTITNSRISLHKENGAIDEVILPAIPVGYTELPFYVCDNGIPVLKTFLVKL
jgi:hypothetical protein